MSKQGLWSIGSKTAELVKMILVNSPRLVIDPNVSQCAHVSQCADGEVGFTYTNGRDRLDAMLRPDNHLVWITKISGNFLPWEDIEISSPDDLATFYAALVNFYRPASQD